MYAAWKPGCSCFTVDLSSGVFSLLLNHSCTVQTRVSLYRYKCYATCKLISHMYKLLWSQVEASQLPELRFLVWPDASQQQISSLLQRCPRLEINPGPKRFSSLLPGRRLPPEADMWRPLDSSAVAAVSQLWWAGLCGSSGGGPSGRSPFSPPA